MKNNKTKKHIFTHNTIITITLLCMLLIAGCSSPELTNNAGSLSPIDTKENIERPDIPRTQIADVAEEYEQPRDTRKLMPARTDVSGTLLDIPFGQTIGEQFPIITREEFPLLKHAPVRVDNNLLVGYDEILRFDLEENSTGKVVFAKDEESNDENIGAMLLFEEQKTVFIYELQLYTGTFKDFSGRDIQILGNMYTIAEVTNTSVLLYGKNIASNLHFQNNEQISVNSSKVSDTRCAVTPQMLSYALYADGSDDGNILLSANESLREAVGWRSLASPLFNIRYKGEGVQNRTTMKIDKNARGYSLKLSLATGEHKIPLVEQINGQLVLGGQDKKLRVTPCEYATQCIAPDTLLALTSPTDHTYILTYRNTIDRKIIFMDPDNRKYEYEFTGTPGIDARAQIRIGEDVFYATIGEKDNSTGTYNISIDQGFKNERASFVERNGVIIKLGDIANNTLPIDIVVPPEKTMNHTKETTHINISYNNNEWIITLEGVELIEKEDTDDTAGSTSYGLLFTVERKDDNHPLNQGDEVTISVPKTPAYGIMVLEG